MAAPIIDLHPTGPEPADNRTPGDAELHRGQLRFAERFATRYTGEFIHVNGLGWFTWDGQRWALSDDGSEVRAATELIKQAIQDLAVMTNKNDRDELYKDISKVESASGLFGVLKLELKR